MMARDKTSRTNRWMVGDTPRGDEYDRRFEALAAQGRPMHGEADLVASYGPGSVLDAGCGTGRVAIELHRRGHDVMGVDQDPSMLAVARQKAPDLAWVQGDLADPELAAAIDRRFDVVVLAGNVLIFVVPGTEGAVVANMARLVTKGGLVIAGYSLRPGGFDLAAHDELAAGAGLVLRDRWSTWDREPFTPGRSADYAVSVHVRRGEGSGSAGG
jgi:SAM-dependent methyltransferase